MRNTISISILLLMLSVIQVSAQSGPQNVLIVQNINSDTSCNVASYYALMRGIPDENICSIQCSTDESISQTECETNIIAPIKTFLANRNDIDYIVLTKGVPLKADYGMLSGPLSITNILVCLDIPYSSPAFTNPFYNLPKTHFSHHLSFGGVHLYLSTRLDGYSIDDIYNMIDGSLALSSGGPICLDAQNPTSLTDGYQFINQYIIDANNILNQNNIPTIFDETNLFIGGQMGLMGYFGWGSNDPSYSAIAYNSNYFASGSIAGSYVSSSARTFNHTIGGQSLMADLIAQGACGVEGYVSEPYIAYIAYPHIIFDWYTRGYNLAESFYASSTLLFWKSTLVGDPLMAAYNIPAPIKISDLKECFITKKGIVCPGLHIVWLDSNGNRCRGVWQASNKILLSDGNVISDDCLPQ